MLKLFLPSSDCLKEVGISRIVIVSKFTIIQTETSLPQLEYYMYLIRRNTHITNELTATAFHASTSLLIRDSMHTRLTDGVKKQENKGIQSLPLSQES